MHEAAYMFVSDFGTFDKVDVIEFGSRDVNGSVRPLFPCAVFTGVDVGEGPGVDVVADAARFTPKRKADVVVSTEVLEHAVNWRRIVANAARCLKVGGRVVLTAAGPGRAPHSAFDGRPLAPGEFQVGAGDGEHYENIDPAKLSRAMRSAGFVDVVVNVVGEDVQATGVLGAAVKPKAKRKPKASPAGKPVVVGEHGPELVDLPRGAVVRSQRKRDA